MCAKKTVVWVRRACFLWGWLEAWKMAQFWVWGVCVFAGVHVCVECLGGRCRAIVGDGERSWVGEHP